MFDGRMNSSRSYGEVPNHLRGPNRVFPALYPPSCQATRSELRKTMRFLPHHNDCGGFYVAVLRKKSDYRMDKVKGESGTRWGRRKETEVAELKGRAVRKLWRPPRDFAFQGASGAMERDLAWHGLAGSLDPDLVYAADGGGRAYAVSGSTAEVLRSADNVRKDRKSVV